MRRNLFFIFSLAFSSLLVAQSPEEIAQKICENFKSRSNFDITEKEVDPIQEGILVIYPSEGKSIQIKSIITVNEIGRWFLAFSANPGKITVWMDDQLVYRGEVKTQTTPKALDDELYEYEFRTLVPPFQGDYKITIHYLPSGNANSIFMWLIDEQGMTQRNVDFRSDFNFMEPHPYRFSTGESIQNPVQEWGYPSSILALQHISPQGINDWQYTTGVMLDAMWQASEYFSLVDNKEFVKDHLNFFTKQLLKESNETGAQMIRGAFFRFSRYRQLDDFGPQTVPFINLPENENYKPLISRALNQIMYKAIRNIDGTFARYSPDSVTIKADDLYMGTYLLCRAYQKYKSNKYLQEAIKQVILFDKWLKDPLTGLYWHAYFTGIDERSSSKFARSNGLALLAKVELLKVIPQDHPERESILKIFKDHAASVRVIQNEDGGWHQVLDKTDTFIETSATAMFVAAFSEGVINKWIYNVEEFERSAIEGWQVVKSMIDAEGNVGGICESTPILFSDKDYQNREIIENDPSGLWAVLNACTAIYKLGK